MKRFFGLISVLFLTAAGFWSCNNDLDVNDQWKEVPVVFGLLNPLDSVHVIKITKAFLGDGNAVYMAQIPDSSYYGDEMEATLIEVDANGNWGRFWILDTMWIHNKQPGDFFSGDQKLYKVKADLREGFTYRISVINHNTGYQAYASTALVKPASITKPRGGQRFFSFTSTAETQAEFNASPNGRVYQLVIRFHYAEVNLNTHDTTYHAIDWQFPNKKSAGLSGAGSITYAFAGTSFYNFVSGRVKVNQDVKRIPGIVDFIAYVGGDELSTYIDITSPINTIVQERPEYTNVINGIGIFSSRTSSQTSCELSIPSIDSLVHGSKTYQLGFVYPIP